MQVRRILKIPSITIALSESIEPMLQQVIHLRCFRAPLRLEIELEDNDAQVERIKPSLLITATLNFSEQLDPR